MTDIKALERKATEIRKLLVEMIFEAGTGHTGSSLSNADILTVLYYHVMKVDPKNPEWEDRDRYVQSKGHAVESYWAVLADKGFIEKEELKTFSQYGSRLIGHPNNKVPGVEMNTGALGHGLSVSVGMALAAKMDKRSHRVFTLMGDGELAEGSVWEAAMAASQYKLDNLIGIIDRNRLQITGKTDEVMDNEPLDKKWESFGWEVIQVDGHDLEALIRVFDGLPGVAGKPTMIIANTLKGKGISLAEGVPSWHHHVPNKEEYESAMKEFSQRMEALI
ncbi:transketolase, N-terminal subunit [Rossellomorea marisflavi]|uniref:transketolase n=1 Tax=Rossellomorea marisflavi TaxID=189381 RepID=UPI0025C779DB|nr:transketolase [Rossellomorea marisflavi]UTE73281.1 transketolase [Rossellomorea marisflavi]GLI84688.1 transketolase, N-terminal subunit [Rossellomorea marisflavi]